MELLRRAWIGRVWSPYTIHAGQTTDKNTDEQITRKVIHIWVRRRHTWLQRSRLNGRGVWHRNCPVCVCVLLCFTYIKHYRKYSKRALCDPSDFHCWPSANKYNFGLFTFGAWASSFGEAFVCVQMRAWVNEWEDLLYDRNHIRRFIVILCVCVPRKYVKNRNLKWLFILFGGCFLLLFVRLCVCVCGACVFVSAQKDRVRIYSRWHDDTSDE